jgi:hypothetical protein
MKSAGRRWLANVALLLTCALVVAAILLDRATPQRITLEANWGSQGTPGALLLLLPGVAFVAVGWLISTRRSDNLIGRMCLAIGLLWTVLMSFGPLGYWIIQTRTVDNELGLWVNWVGDWLWVPALGLFGTHLLLRLPDGRLISPRWRHYSRFCTIVLVVVTLSAAVELDTVGGIPGSKNPVLPYLEWARVLEPLFILFPVSFIGAISCLVMRYRRSDDEVRHQIKWIAFGGLSFVGSFVVVGIVLALGGIETSSLEGQVLTNITLIGYSLVPISIGVSVLKYRLSDIDVIVNRALVYGSLTTTLGLAYLVTVALLQQVFTSVTGTSDLSIAISTLTVAALFGPLRARLQTFIDRRFYRGKYDATQTVEAFSARLRDEVDIDSLTKDLLRVVQESMQPRSVSLWLRAGSSESPATSAHG